MRSSRSKPDRPAKANDPLDPGANGFAHRGLHRSPAIVENSFDAFAAALAMPCGIECDLRLTADDHILVFHDADARRITGDAAVIGRSSLSDLRHLRVGGQQIPTLPELLKLVEGRVPLLIEAKVDGDARRFGRALARDLGAYRGAVGVMSFHAGLIAWLRSEATSLRRGLVIADRLSPLGRWTAMMLADAHFLAVETTALDKPWVMAARRAVPVYSWTVKNAAQRRELAPLADGLIWEADGRP